MSVKKTILTEKSYKDLIDYVNKVEFFKDFISVINPNKYEIITDSDIESSAVSWPVQIIYEDKPTVPVVNFLIPDMKIKQTWKNSDNKIDVKIESFVFENKLFEMQFDCIIRYLGDIDIDAKWIEKPFYLPDIILDCILEQFEDILKKILS